ncbi:MAG: ATP-binding protein [Thermoanaerobaculaceae bacterium]|nr:ATP-binding protein [Thermoanaerobaculaceae bacterium]
MEHGEVAGSAEVESIILRWRERALDYVLWAGLGIGTVPLLILHLVAPTSVSSGLRLVGLGIYLLVAGVALARRLAHDVRAWGFLLALFGLAGVTLAARGLEGAGRLVLVILPLFATVLLGARSGYVAAAMSLALYAAVAVLSARGVLSPLPLVRGASSGAEFWLLQGAMLVLILGPVMFLINRFVGLMRGALVAEREAAGRVAEADRERRRLERVVLEAGERERMAVGHQLHDGPCQHLTAALLRCKVAENSFAARGSREDVAHIQAIAEMLDASAGEIHDLARGLSPPALAPGALAAALSDLVHRLRSSGAIECVFVHDDLAQPEDADVSSQLFRIAQEAVRNAVRHAKPGRVRVELTRSDGGLRLRVQDDGIGIPPDADHDRMGLRIMRYRAELMGGSLSIDAVAGGGTVVTCTLPLAAPDSSRGGDA